MDSQIISILSPMFLLLKPFVPLDIFVLLFNLLSPITFFALTLTCKEICEKAQLLGFYFNVVTVGKQVIRDRDACALPTDVTPESSYFESTVRVARVVSGMRKRDLTRYVAVGVQDFRALYAVEPVGGFKALMELESHNFEVMFSGLPFLEPSYQQHCGRIRAYDHWLHPVQPENYDEDAIADRNTLRDPIQQRIFESMWAEPEVGTIDLTSDPDGEWLDKDPRKRHKTGLTTFTKNAVVDHLTNWWKKLNTDKKTEFSDLHEQLLDTAFEGDSSCDREGNIPMGHDIRESTEADEARESRMSNIEWEENGGQFDAELYFSAVPEELKIKK